MAIALILAVFNAPASVFAVTNYYGTGHEESADYGSQVTRSDGTVTCTGTGSGFVFDDLWQGTATDTGWIEIGSSYCDVLHPLDKWVWAYFKIPNTYYESVLTYSPPNPASSHTYKIWNSYGGIWGIYIDGATWVTLNGIFPGGSSFNSADVGLEVTPSRINSHQAWTAFNSLRAWTTQSTSASWSGNDDCRDTSSHIYPAWLSNTSFRTALNYSQSTSC